MKILVVHPGASVATKDVWVGLVAGLKSRGHEVHDYALDMRIERSAQYLTYCWRKGGKSAQKPTSADFIYRASEELVTRALRLEANQGLDVVLIVSGMCLHPDVLPLMKRVDLKVALLFTESPYDDERQARLLPFLDVAWTNERSSARAMRIKYLAHAWTPEVHLNVPDLDVASHDVVFVGTGFQERIDTLEAVDWTGIDLGLYGSWDLMGSRNHLRQYIKGGYLENEVTAALYKRAKIGLNLYRQSKGFGRTAPRIGWAESLNPRAYELAATGCFTISDYRQEVTEVFGDLVPTFTTPQDLEARIRESLADDLGRSRVQAQLPSAVARHTWHARAAQIESDLLDAGIGAREGSVPDEPDLARVAGG